jgi:hypothetical protein
MSKRRRLDLADMIDRWRDNPVSFIETVLFDPETHAPYRLLPAERDFLRFAFRRGKDGRLLYPEQVFSAPKKSGKTALNAIVTLTTSILFGNGSGEAVVVANSFDQAQGRVFAQIRRIVQASPLLKASSDLKVQADRIVVAGAEIIAIPCDAGSAAGSNQVVASFDELWAYSSEPAHRLFDEMIPPPTRHVSCRLTTTYAGFSGESTLLEALYKRGMAQKQVAPSLYAGDGILMAWHTEPIAPWQTEAWIEESRRSLRPNQFARMIGNQWVTSEAGFVDLDDYDQCVDSSLGPAAPDKKLAIWVGLDIGIARDSTAVVAVTFDKLNKQLRLVNHRVFYPAHGATVQFLEVEAHLHYLRDRFNLRELRLDPWQAERTFQELTAQRWPIVKYDQTPANLVAMGSNLYDAITGHWLKVYPCDELRLAISHAIARESGRGWKITKEKSSHKVDIVVALAMAALAAVESQSSHQLHVVRTPEFLAAYSGMPVRTPYGPSRSQRIAPQSAFPIAQTPSPADCGAPGYRGFGSTYAPAAARHRFMQSQTGPDPVSFFPVKAYDQ